MVSKSEPNLFRQLASARPPGQDQHLVIGDISDSSALGELVQRSLSEVVLRLLPIPWFSTLTKPHRYMGYQCDGEPELTGELAASPASLCCVNSGGRQGLRKPRVALCLYREPECLDGHYPDRANKAGAEIGIPSWRVSFRGPALHQTPHLRIGTARAGNVIGGGD